MSQAAFRLGLWRITALSAAFGVGAALASAWLQDVTPDEPVHLEWSRRLLRNRVTERRSNEYFESKSPISMLNVAARGYARFTLSVRDQRVLKFWSRLPTVGLFALLLASVFLVARAWVGTVAAHLATIACALDPNLIAHASLATVDVAYALFHFLGLTAAYAFVRRPSVLRGLLLGVATGLAFSAKFSAMLLLGGVLLGVFARERHGAEIEDPTVRARKALKLGVSLTAAGTSAALVVCAMYLFTHVGTPLSAITWDSTPMQRLAQWFPRLRLPLPADFLTGFDLSMARERNLNWRVVMLGRYHPKGVPYYFLLLWLMKTPLFLLLGQVAGYARAVQTGILFRNPALRFIALNLLLLLVYFSFFFHAQIGYRFVLMCLPLGYILAAAGLASLQPSRSVVLAGAVVLLTALGENSAYAGNHIAFTNLAVQPKKHVFRWISHSNIDWRQNEDKVDAYLASAGIGRARLNPPHLLRGRNLLRHSHAAGNLRFERYRWVRENLDPVGHFGHTFILFDVDDRQFERMLEETRRVRPSLIAGRICPAEGSALSLSREEPVSLPRARPHEAFVACVVTPEGADLVLRSRSGALVAGRAGVAGGDYLEAGQEVWFRLDPGRHVLALVPQAEFTGGFQLARGRASVWLSPDPRSEADLARGGSLRRGPLR